MNSKLQVFQTINRFHFNCIRAAAHELTVQQLAEKLRLTGSHFLRLQKDPIFIPLEVSSNIASKTFKVANEYGLSFPTKHRTNIISKLSPDTKTILTGFQYRIAVLLLYDIHSSQSSGVNLLDRYFRKLDNDERLEDNVNLTSNLLELKKLLESRGVFFPSYNTIHIDPNFKKIKIEELKQVLDTGMPAMVDMDTEDLLLLFYLDYKHSDLKSESMKIDFTSFMEQTGETIFFLTQRVNKLHYLGIISVPSLNGDNPTIRITLHLESLSKILKIFKQDISWIN